MRRVDPKSPAPPPAWVRSVAACVFTEPIDVSMPRAGTIVSAAVRDGDLVHEGQELFTISAAGAPCDGPTARLPADGLAASTHASTTVRSSVAGVITRCWGRAGASVRQRQRLVSIVRQGSVQVLALFDRGLDLSRVVGTQAIVELDGPAGPALLGRVLGTGAGLFSLGGPEATARGPTRVLVQARAFPLELLRHGRTAGLQVRLARRALA